MIVWLASYPRSGATCVRLLLKRYFGLRTISKHDGTGFKASAAWPSTYARISGEEDLVAVQTHDAPEDNAKAIYVVRDPEAAISSYRTYLARHGNDSISKLELIAGADRIDRWDRHVSSWQPQSRPNTLLVRYEDLTAAPDEIVTGIGEFLNITPLPQDDSGPASSAELIRPHGNDRHKDSLTAGERAALSLLFGADIKTFGYKVQGDMNVEAAARELADAVLDIWRRRSDEPISLREPREVEAPSDAFAAMDAGADELRRAQRAARHAETLQAELRRQLEEARASSSLLRDELKRLQQGVAPRLRAIATLQPMRTAISLWRRMKRGELEVQADGLILPIRQVPPPNGIRMSAAAPSQKSTAELHPKSPAEETRQQSCYLDHEIRKPLGVAVFAFNRPRALEAVLESLKRQDGLAHCHVWIDGDQGRPALRKVLDETEQVASGYEVKAIHRNRGNYGFRKMIIVALRQMFETYDRVLVLEDDCFPTRHAIKGFSAELDMIEQHDEIFSVYGHPFLVPGEADTFTRFQGWGWATTRAKFTPIWDELLKCYLMAEEDYLGFVDSSLTPEVLARIEATPGRSPSDTLKRFFAWDETVCLLTAKNGLDHRPSAERLIYNFGIGDESTHFADHVQYRRPPFNMVSRDDIWSYF